MTIEEAMRVEDLFEKQAFDVKQVLALRGEIHRRKDRLKALLQGLSGLEKVPSGKARLGIGIALWLAGKSSQAAELLESAHLSPIQKFFLASIYLEKGRYGKARELFSSIEDLPGAEFEVAAGLAGALRGLGEPAEALKLIRRHAKTHEQHPDYHFQVGFCQDLLGEHQEARASYERALELDPAHVPSLFRIAFNADLRGEDQTALEYYERAVASGEPVYENVLINLGLLYEDLGRYREAAACYGRVLEANPTHARALLFLRDAEASTRMYIDEDGEKRMDKKNLLFDTPVTDFELSIRSRNCLEAIGIRTLGDLVRTTEQQLLSYKNFGETSLSEIKNIMAQKGLRLGQALEDGSGGEMGVPQSVLAKPISEIELSVRGRNCLERLGVHTLGELIEHTEDELLGCRNFGQASMNEIRMMLRMFGLAMKPSVSKESTPKV